MKLASAFRVEITPNNYERFFKAKNLQDMILQDTEPLFSKIEKIEKTEKGGEAPLEKAEKKKKKNPHQHKKTISALRISRK